MIWLEKWREIRAGFERRGLHPGVTAAYAGLVLAFLLAVGQFYSPGKGFSYLIAFGGEDSRARLSKLQKIDFHVELGSAGYDAQYYAQIAMDPSLQNRELPKVVDNLPYRARRILFPATAHVLGLGQPPLILEAYALQNVLCWLLLAAILLHWFPARTWDNFFRWTGVLLSLGLCVSFRNALVDGPSLMLITLGLFLAETNRPWWAAAVLGLSGLGKETNLLSGAALLPRAGADRRAWALALARGLLIAVPLGLWLVYLAVRVGPAMDPGSRNFGLPFAAYLHKWQEVLAELPDVGWLNLGALWGVCMLVSLTVQFLFLVLRPRWDLAWWRVGLSFMLLMVFLGEAVWEGYPGAASRVLLPMQVAFNILVPAGRGWRWVLVAGNLTLFAAPFILESPAMEGYVLGGKSSLFSTSGGQAMTVQFGRGWYASEGNRSFFWSWARGNAAQEIRNPHPFVVRARMRFSVATVGRRTVRLKLNGTEIWSTKLGEHQVVTATLSSLPLPPGKNALEWETDEPSVVLSYDPRKLAFVLQNFHLDVLGEMPAENARP